MSRGDYTSVLQRHERSVKSSVRQEEAMFGIVGQAGPNHFV